MREFARREGTGFTITSPGASAGLRGLCSLLHVSWGMRHEVFVEGWAQFRTNCWLEFCTVECIDRWAQSEKATDDINWVQYMGFSTWYGGYFKTWGPETFKVLRRFPSLKTLIFVMREVSSEEKKWAVSAVTAVCPDVEIVFDTLL